MTSVFVSYELVPFPRLPINPKQGSSVQTTGRPLTHTWWMNRYLVTLSIAIFQLTDSIQQYDEKAETSGQRLKFFQRENNCCLNHQSTSKLSRWCVTKKAFNSQFPQTPAQISVACHGKSRYITKSTNHNWCPY